MTFRERLRVLDDIGFIGVPQGLSATGQQQLERHINRFLREQAKTEKDAREKSKKKTIAKKAR